MSPQVVKRLGGLEVSTCLSPSFWGLGECILVLGCEQDPCVSWVPLTAIVMVTYFCILLHLMGQQGEAGKGRMGGTFSGEHSGCGLLQG